MVGHHVCGVTGHQRYQCHVCHFAKPILLIAQQKQHIHTLIGLLVAMFCIEIIQENDDNTQYVSIGSMGILVDTIVKHIRD
jgi:hypothetical protein